MVRHVRTTPAASEAGFVLRTLSSFRSRNFRLFFVGQTISNTGNWLTMVALTLLVLHRTGSGVAVGLLSACQFGPILLLSAWAGVIVDRTNKRNLLVVTQTLEMCQSFALAALAFMHHAPLVAFYVTAAAGGCMLAFDNPVRRTFVNEMVPAEDVPNAVTLYSAMVNISRIAGPAIAGVLIVTVGYGWCFTVDAISYLTVLAALGHDAPGGAAAGRGDASRGGPDPRRAEVHRERARALDHVRDAADRRDHQLQLHRRVPALRREGAPRQRRRRTRSCIRPSARERWWARSWSRGGRRSASGRSRSAPRASARRCSCSRPSPTSPSRSSWRRSSAPAASRS